MKPNFVSIGAGCAALGVALGAFGAHSLRASLGQTQLALWETATRYWFVGSLGMLGFGLFRERRPGGSLSGLFLLCGSVLFSASLYALALGAPRVVGAITPFGGAGLIAGFICFSLCARAPR